jgi:hypothetical protein
MRFYNQQHQFYCGVDLHARTMYLCILDGASQVVYDKNLTADPVALIGPRPGPADIRDATWGLFAARLPARRAAA